MNRTLTSFLAGAAMLTVAGGAQAVTITQSVQFGPGPTDYTAATGATSGAAASATQFAYFNTNLGTLNSVTFSFSYGFTSSISITNNSGSSASGNARTQSASQFSSNVSAITSVLNSRVNNLNDPVDGTSVSFGSSTLTPIAYDLRGNVTSYNLSSGQNIAFSSTGSGSTSGVLDSTADISAFGLAGGGAYTPLFSTLSGLVVSNSGGNVTAVQTTTATGTLTISYDYSVPTVPEPASIALLGAGLLGLGLIRRKA